jgi:ABC-2 type transport system permease protein
MLRILDIASKDLLQLIRDRMIFLFLLIMPVVFTFLFGYAFGGFDRSSDPRLPLGFLDQDQSRISKALHDLLSKSDVVRLVDFSPGDEALMRAQVSDEKLAAGLILPIGYAKSIVREKAPRLELIADTGLPAGTSAESEVLSALLRLDSAIRAALILEQTAGEQIPFTFAFQQVLDGWQDPPIRIIETTSTVVPSSLPTPPPG